MAREFEPVVGQWYENIDENDSFRVLSVDADAELIEIEYLDGDIEEIDLDKIEQPEGWSGEEIGKAEDEEEEDAAEDDDWDDDEDEDEDDLDEETDGNY